MKLAYTRNFITEGIAEALRIRGWECFADDDPGEAVLEKRVDLALTPALDYATHLGLVDYALVPRFALLAGGLAGVMVIAFNEGLKTISSLAVKNAGSAGSIIAALILVEKHGIDPTLVEVASDASVEEMLNAADGALLEGDDAIFASPGRASWIDLADEWEDVTETPLPWFLAWGRVEEVTEQALETFNEAAEAAMRAIPSRAADSRSEERVSALYQRYLQGNLTIELPEDRATGALTPLFHYAFYHGITQDVPSVKYLPEGTPVGGEDAPEVSPGDAPEPLNGDTTGPNNNDAETPDA